MSPLPELSRSWFFDTCTLITMQASIDLNQLVQTQMAGEDCILLQEVVEELEFIASQNRDASPLAAMALKDLAWLGAPQSAAEYADLDDIVHWQSEVADGRFLKHPREHWAEACIIAAIEVLPEDRGAVAFLSEEYSARIHAASHEWCMSMSVHRYMYELVKASIITAQQALDISNELHDVGRGIECILNDYSAPNPRGLGRPGRP
jgi:hypothetical protein